MPPLHSTNESDDDLLSELQSQNTYFDNLVNSIPAKLCVAGASGDNAYNPKYMHGQHKESKEARRARNKLVKDNKYNLDKRESTLDVKRRVAKEKEEMEEDDNDIDVGDDVIMSDEDGEEDDAQTSTSTNNNTQDKKKNDTSIAGFTSRIEMLRAKLHAKMAEKRAAAGKSTDTTDSATASAATINPDTSSPALVSKRAARRAEKRKRQEAAKQRNKKKLTSIAESSKSTNSQEIRVIKKDLGGSTYNAPSKSTSNNNTTTITTTAAQDLATIDYQSIAGLKPRVDGALENKSLLALTGKKNKKKSLEKLLADAERKQARLKELKLSSVEEDRVKAKNIEWGEAMKVAGGSNELKKNDPKLLKKALKRKAKKKAASAKAWNVRLDQAKDAATKKQSIRTHNLDSRKLGGAVGANLSSKRIVEQDNNDEEGGGKKEKRRRLGPHSNRAGFEGKKSGFINGSSECGAGAGGGSAGGNKKGK